MEISFSLGQVSQTDSIRFSSYAYVFTGDMYEIGVDKGKYYSLNVPLKDGIDDHSK